ncbi:MAG: ATP-binding protein [Opitutales bacterium]
MGIFDKDVQERGDFLDFLRRRKSLRFHFAVRLFLPAALLLGVVGWLVFQWVSSVLERQLQEEVELIARALAKPVSYSLERERTNSLMDALESAFDFERVYGAYLYDIDGRLLAQAGERRSIRRDAQPGVDLIPKSKPSGGYQEYSGEPIFSFFVPLDSASGEPIGVLQITRSGQEMRAAIRQLWHRFLFGYSLILAGFCLLMLLLYQFSFHRPVRRLYRSIRRIRPGKRHERVPVAGPRELFELGNALNEMLAAIEMRQSKLTRSESERGQLKRQLRASEQLAVLGEMAASIGHEVGTPLATIDGHAQRLSRKFRDSEPDGDVLAIRGEVKRIEKFVRELLSFGDGSSRGRQLINFETILQEASREARRTYPGEVRIHTDHSAFPGGKPMVLAESLRLQLALKNIIANALQAAPAVSVDCWVRFDSGELFCQIDDNGPGIPTEIIERIFEPFYTSRPGKGTGLGLALADRIISEHGGRLRAGRSDAGGAKLTIRLPLEK